MDIHKARCPKSPELFDRIKAALDDGTGKIVTSQAYQANVARRADSLGTNTLFRAFGTWKAVADAYGLTWSNPATNPKPKYQKAVKRLNLALADAERLRNIPGEDEQAAIAAPCVLHAYRVTVTDVTGIVGTPMGDLVVRHVEERMMIR